MAIINAPVLAYDANMSKQPWRSVPSRSPHVTGDDMVVATDTVVVDGAIFIPTVDL